MILKIDLTKRFNVVQEATTKKGPHLFSKNHHGGPSSEIGKPPEKCLKPHWCFAENVRNDNPNVWRRCF